MIPEKDWSTVRKHVVEGSLLYIITMARLLGIQTKQTLYDAFYCHQL